MIECGGFEIIFKTAANAKKGAEIIKEYISEQTLQSYYWLDNVCTSGKSVCVDGGTIICWSDYELLTDGLCEVLNENMNGKVVEGEVYFSNETTGFSNTKRIVVDDDGISFEDADSLEDMYMNLATTTDDVEEIKEILINMGYDPDEVEEVCNSYDEEYAGNDVNENAVETIREIYTSHKSDNLLDSLINNGMIKVDDESAYRNTSGRRCEEGPKDKNWKTEVLDDGTLTITDYKGKDTIITIPSEIKGYEVSAISSYCFSPYKSGLRSARKELYSSGLEKVIISAGIKNIDGYVFEGCESLEEIEFNEGLESIGFRAFEGCRGLTKIVFPNSLKFIGEQAFECANLQSIKMPHSPVQCMSHLSSNSITEPVFSGDMTKMYLYPNSSPAKEYIIPESIRYLSVGVFYYCDNLEILRVPDGVEYIGNFTFGGSLKKVYLPDSIKEIDFAAFGYGEKIKTVIYTNNPYVIAYAKENKIKVVSN